MMMMSKLLPKLLKMRRLKLKRVKDSRRDHTPIMDREATTEADKEEEAEDHTEEETREVEEVTTEVTEEEEDSM